MTGALGEREMWSFICQVRRCSCPSCISHLRGGEVWRVACNWGGTGLGAGKLRALLPPPVHLPSPSLVDVNEAKAVSDKHVVIADLDRWGGGGEERGGGQEGKMGSLASAAEGGRMGGGMRLGC